MRKINGRFRLKGVMIAVAFFAVLAAFYLLFVKPTSSDAVVHAYFSSRNDVSGYTVKDRVWSYSCCSERVISSPRKANHVRYTVDVTYRDGHTEKDIVDLNDARKEDAQFDDFEMGFALGGHQDWKVGKFYGPTEVPPPVTWSL